MQDLEGSMKAINRILTKGETVLSGIPCTYDKKSPFHDTPYYGLLVLTSYRVIFYSSLGNPFYELLDYSLIDSVKETNGFSHDGKNLIVKTPFERHLFKVFADCSDFDQFVEQLMTLIDVDLDIAAERKKLVTAI